MDRLKPRPDPALIAACALGEPGAWDEFVRRFNRRIALYVVRERQKCGGGSGDTEAEAVRDLTQDVYVRLLANDCRALRDFRGDNDFAVFTYLARVVRAVVTDQNRRDRSQKRAASLVSIEADDGDAVSLRERLEAGSEALPDRVLAERMLPERLRELIEGSTTGANAARDALIFQLYAIDGLTAREIAAKPVFGLSVKAVEGVIHRVRERLRSALAESNLSD
jgi:RNA polymerase sigma factor (sigma-70 family)